jgi:hypothetical protein
MLVISISNLVKVFAFSSLECVEERFYESKEAYGWYCGDGVDVCGVC